MTLWNPGAKTWRFKQAYNVLYTVKFTELVLASGVSYIGLLYNKFVYGSKGKIIKELCFGVNMLKWKSLGSG